MRLDTIRQKLKNAAKKVLEKDSYLLVHDISERSIAHRLAMYLTPKFVDFDVDCEYNGNVEAHNGRKYIYILKDTAQRLGLLNRNAPDQELIYCCVYPDIIIHKRGRNGIENNLLVIEIKKSSSKESSEWDDEKLKRFTSHEDENNFDYRVGAFIVFHVGEKVNFEIMWYQNGRRL